MTFVSVYFCCPFHPTSLSLCCERLTYIVHYWPDLKREKLLLTDGCAACGTSTEVQTGQSCVFISLFIWQAGESCCFKRAEHLEWNHKVWVQRRMPPVTPLCGSHHLFLVLAPGFILPPPSLLLCAYRLSIGTAGLLSVSGFNVSEPSSLICAEPKACGENILIHPFIFFWPTDRPLLLHVRHCTLNAS